MHCAYFRINFLVILILFFLSTGCSLFRSIENRISKTCAGRTLPIAVSKTVPVPETNTSPPEIWIGIYQRNEAEDCLNEVYSGQCRADDARIDETGSPRCLEQHISIQRKDIKFYLIASDDGGMNEIQIRLYAEGLRFNRNDSEASYYVYSDDLIQAIAVSRGYDPLTIRYDGLKISDWVTISAATGDTIQIFVYASNIGGRLEQHRGCGISQTLFLELSD